MSEQAPEAHHSDQPASTGHVRVDQALSRLAEVEDLPVAEHVPIFEDVHQALRATLREDSSADDSGSAG